ncbi:MAG: transcriptional regulator [Saccharothrix sp.]|nr:transcriptional regulator [Saccharothrix sp.]
MAASAQLSHRKPIRRARARGRARRMLGVLAALVHAVVAAGVLAALLVGLPWALTRFVGWPLPDRLPSWAEVEGVLVGPMTTVFLLDVLACLTWLVWALFTLDVARCAVDVAREERLPDLSAAGPVHRIAAVLVGAVLICVLGQRSGTLASDVSSAGLGAVDVVAAAPAWNPVPERPAVRSSSAAETVLQSTASVGAVERSVRAKSAVVLAYDPEIGVYDSLWRMAERTLGDGNRWPEVYELNKGKSQPGGGTFTRPSLVFPGEEMVLPDDATAPPPSRPGTPPPAAATPPPGPSPSTTRPPATSQVLTTTQAPAVTRAPSTNAPGEPGFEWGEELFVGLGLAAAVSTALVAARRHNRRRYRPGSGERGDLPVAPVVYQLRLAHLRTDRDDLDADEPGRRTRSVPRVVFGHDDNTFDCHSVLPVGVRDGREIALDLATVHGLGLLGAGATGAVRALLVAALTTSDGPAQVIVTAEDLAALLGRRAAQAPLPTGLHVAADLDAALDVLEAETLVRVNEHRPTNRPWTPVVLVARAPERRSRRLYAVLDNGSTVGVSGLLLGQWNPGVTVYVRDDGTISATSPGRGEPLRGTRVFRLGDDHTADLLELLHRAEPDTATADQPTPVSPLRRHDVSDEPPVNLRNDVAPAGHGEHPITEPAGKSIDHAERRGDRDLEIFGSPPVPVSSPGSRLCDDKPSPGTDLDHPTSVEPDDTAFPGPDVAHVPVRISVLGPLRVWWRPEPAGPDVEVGGREVTAAFQPRLRELLVFLALHPDGASREALTSALWPTSPAGRTTNALNTSLSRLRHALTTATDGTLTDIVLTDGGRYRLDPDLVVVDYRSFADAVTARRTATTDQQRIAANRHVVDSYRGPLADGMSTEWIETAREAIRRDAIDAVAALARALADHDPQQTMALLEIARAFDPYNELIYRDIMRLQERLGQPDAIPRTLTLLTARLAEIDDRPTPQTIDLADRLRRRHDTTTRPHSPGSDHGNSKAG